MKKTQNKKQQKIFGIDRDVWERLSPFAKLILEANATRENTNK